MKIKKYKVEIHNSVFEAMREFKGKEITEYFIPEYNLCFNTDTGSLNVFYHDFGRYEGILFDEVDIPDNQAKLVKDYHELNLELYDMLRMYQNDSLHRTNIDLSTKEKDR